MQKWFKTQFGILTTASLLALVSFPFLYSAGFGDEGVTLGIGLGLLFFSLILSMVTVVQKRIIKNRKS